MILLLLYESSLNSIANQMWWDTQTLLLSKKFRTFCTLRQQGCKNFGCKLSRPTSRLVEFPQPYFHLEIPSNSGTVGKWAIGLQLKGLLVCFWMCICALVQYLKQNKISAGHWHPQIQDVYHEGVISNVPTFSLEQYYWFFWYCL